MARRKSPFGRNLQKILELAPPDLARDLFLSPQGVSGTLVDLDDIPSPVDSELLIAKIASQDPEVLGQLEEICRNVIDLSEGKGTSSLDTVVHRKMFNTDIDAYEEQKDELCKAIWVFTRFNSIFLDAQSFHTARRYREHGKLYSAFETADDAVAVLEAEQLDLDALSNRISEVLGLPVKTTATALDLPNTAAHPRSVMVVVRHGGALSSVLYHRDDGLRRPYYYRPANEAILIYTPSLRLLEVCATGYVVRKKTSDTFAEVVLGQDLLKKPLTNRNFNLDRFRRSLHLPLPDFDDVEITFAKVTELETRLGNWKRRVLLQVTVDDDIEEFADRYMGKMKAAASRFGYSRVTLVVGYAFRDGGKAESLKLWVSSGNNSNAQNDRDPRLRDLGLRLLGFWGLMESQRLLDERESARHFEALLFLHEYPDDEVTGSALTQAGIDLDRLQSAQIVHKKSRQDIVLVEDDDDVLEAELETGSKAGTLKLAGPFGEELGLGAEDDFKLFHINHGYVAELLLGALKNEMGASRAVVSTDLIAELGEVPIGTSSVPTYLVRTLSTLEKPEQLDLEFRRRHLAGPGLILTTGDTDFKYLGSNVVIALKRVVSMENAQIILDPDALEQEYRAGQALVTASDAAQLIRHTSAHATLHLPGKPPFNLFTEKQIILFSRLVDAAGNGQLDVKTPDLMRGTGSKSPEQLFSKPLWAHLRDIYLTRGQGRTWRLCLGEFVT